jgi:hypothetical protein
MADEREDDQAIRKIRALLASYNSLGDRGRVAELAELFTVGGVLETGSWKYEGRQGIFEGFTRRDGSARHPDFSLMRHHLTTCDITLEGAGTASCRTYFMVITNIGLDRTGTYIDQVRQEDDGHWRFAHRQVRLDWISRDSLMPLQPTHHRRVDPS